MEHAAGTACPRLVRKLLYLSRGRLVLADDRERSKSSCGPYGAVHRLGDSRQGLSILYSRRLAFGEDHRVDLLEKFAVQQLDASLHGRRLYEETHGQLRTRAGQK